MGLAYDDWQASSVPDRVARALDDEWVGFADHLGVLAVVVDLGEEVTHGVEPGTLLVVGANGDPRGLVGVRGLEGLLLGEGVVCLLYTSPSPRD